MAEDSPSPFPPRCAKKFIHECHLSSGGFGSIHVATQRDLDRKVALKLLSTNFAEDPEQLERFRVEAKATAALSHENIVIVHDHDVEDGVAWIAYELLPGPDLRDFLRNGPLQWQDTIRLGIQLASALAEAHGRKILHRDVKPENVILAGSGWYKVTDFGIARWREGGGVKTQAGVILGTPRYMAPEVIRVNEVSEASDIYALGVLLFEACTGRPPFLDGPGSRLFSEHLNAPPPLVRDLRPDIPRGADDVFQKALEKSPEDRYASMLEFKERLEAERDESLGEFRPPVQKVTAPRSTTRSAAHSKKSGMISRSSSVVSRTSTRVHTQPDPSSGVWRWLLEIRPWKMILVMGLLGTALGAGFMVGKRPAPAGTASLAGSAGPGDPATTLATVGRRFDEALPQMVDYCQKMQRLHRKQVSRIASFLQENIPFAQKHHKLMQELIRDLPPDSGDLKGLSATELLWLSRVRAWQYICHHRLVSGQVILDWVAGGRGSHGDRKEEMDENVIGKLRSQLQGFTFNEKEVTLMHSRAMDLQQEQLRRILAAPEMDHPELLLILQDLEHMAHPYRITRWRRGFGGAGRAVAQLQSNLNKLGEREGTPVGDLMLITWENALEPAAETEMRGLTAARKRTIEGLRRALPGLAPTLVRLEKRWTEQDEELEKQRSVPIDDDDNGGSWGWGDQGDKRIWARHWSERDLEIHLRDRSDRRREARSNGSPSPGARPSPGT